MTDSSAAAPSAQGQSDNMSDVLALEINCEDAMNYVMDNLPNGNITNDILDNLNSLPNSAFLQQLSEMMLIPEFTECFAIAFYPILPDLVGRWARLADHQLEQAACALGRLIHIQPQLKRYCQELLLSGPSFLRNIDNLIPSTASEELLEQLQTMEVNQLREILLAAFRLLTFSHSLFNPLIPTNPLLALVQHPDLSIRTLAIEVLSISLGFGDSARTKWIERHVGGPDDEIIGPWEGKMVDYGVLLLLESRRVKDAKTAVRQRQYFRRRTGRHLSPSDLGPHTGEICGILFPRFNTSNSIPPHLVMTETTRMNLRNIASLVVAEKPILLQSVPGAGKTFLIDEIAKLFGRFEDIVRITLTDQTDAKLLLGTYVSTTPGSFTWQSGILTTAVREGKWIVIEDIERAGNDVLSVLLPLLEGRPLDLSGRGEVTMGKGGQLIATTRLLSGPKSALVDNMLGIRRWTRITVLPPTDQDLLEIIKNLLPRLHFIAPVLLRVYISLRDVYGQPTIRSSRKVSPRDLFKWAKRTSSLCANLTDETIPREIWDDIFLESVDCFAAMIPSLPSRRALIEKIGSEMGFPPERVNLYFESHIPQIVEEPRTVKAGRISIPKKQGSQHRSTRPPFAYTNHAKRLIEQLGVSVLHQEPILLVGETGTGKTTIVQHLADMLHHRLVVVNVSQQTESSDLLGGFKPVDPRTLAVQLKDSFEGLFERTFSVRRNEIFLSRIAKCYTSQKWSDYVKLLKEAISKAELRFQKSTDEDGSSKKKRRIEGDLKELWAKFSDSVQSFEIQVSAGKGKSHAFSFVEGTLIKALKRGHWLLLDEINLAAADTLESISGLLREGGSIIIPEKGDLEPVQPHPNFRIFACMNPATDVGKRDLPPALRSQFTELYVGSPDESMADLLLIIKQYVGHLCVGDDRAPSDVAHLYLKIKLAAESHDIVDGVGQKPHFSIRTLTRTLTYVADTTQMYGLRRALYEGFCMSFSTMLERESRDKVIQTIAQSLYSGSTRNLRSALRSLPKRPDDEYIQIASYWIEKGAEQLQPNPHYIVKPGTSVEENLQNLVRASLTRRYPILLQGPTSSGKTSMIEHLAKLTGHKFLRINNHEHTSLDEYLGNYVSSATGEFIFQEGILVQALRQGYWIVLDELNLAPSDVLEALNRLLDDNRELLIPETQEIIIPHPHFMLFATQNPAGLYGGRKVLSRAFRNRFLELEFDDIPEHELEEILCLRCEIPPSYGARIVEVYKQLSVQRQSTRLFEQRNSFATLRDLFRWAQREAVGYQQLAENGYMLLAERVRREQERMVVKQVIEKVMKVKIEEESLYDFSKIRPEWRVGSKLIWTKAMRRLFILVNEALINNEPVLLVGETGSGKTTVCQVLAELMGKELHIINAHQNTETADIIGGQRPYRDRFRYQQDLVLQLRAFFSHRPETRDLDLGDLAEEFSKLDVERLITSSQEPEKMSANIDQIRTTFILQKILFEWVDGALVQAMKQGEPFLLDEISLADDSVLERLNSVLEPSRQLVLAEKGGEEVHVTAVPGFQFLATMNPGGDYGKKELSPALRNRFTEIWVPPVEDRNDLNQIVRAALDERVPYSESIVEFAEWFTRRMGATGTSVSIRDVLGWVQFVNITHSFLGAALSLFHGALMVYVDGIGTSSGTEFSDVAKEKAICVSFLSELLKLDLSSEYLAPVSVASTPHSFTLGRFSIPIGNGLVKKEPFSFQAPTTASNGMKVVRAMQLPKSILLEGAPGIGKTTLISAIATAATHHLIRINLSEQTDLMDLFGADVPVEDGSGGEFGWKDAPFLRAMQSGDWVLLDELNLASQSVLEGLNACLDHRGTIYVPELDRSFSRHPDFRIFAAQNPHAQGGGRKGLPKSFINRFSVVHVESLTLDDMCIISQHLFPSINGEIVQKLITFITIAQKEANSNTAFASLGRPWEFNLRDALRWIALVKSQSGLQKERTAADYLPLIVSQRLRTARDKEYLTKLFTAIVGPTLTLPPLPYLGLDTLQIGLAILPRGTTISTKITSLNVSIEQLSELESLTLCIQEGWPCLLVGPAGSGKTSLIRTLAALTGASLTEFSMNNDTDANDIIGGYEQRDLNRQIMNLSVKIQKSIIERLAWSTEPTHNGPYGIILKVLSKLPCSENAVLSIQSEILQCIDHQGSMDLELTRLIKQLVDLLGDFKKGNGGGKFQWYDGILVDVLLQGGWIILDNANLCSPSVLDRLNSLLEPGGSLVLHESTDLNGKPRSIKPHPSFRIFLTMDPRYGELSRAMRNRAGEIFVDVPSKDLFYDDLSSFDLHIAGRSTLSSLSRVDDTLDKDIDRDLSGLRLDPLSQFIEYMPLSSLPYLRRWLKGSNGATSVSDILSELESISGCPVNHDLAAYIHRSCAALQMTPSFATSQCLLPILNDYLPSDGNVFELQSSTITTEDLSYIYDLSVHSRRMRIIIQNFSKFGGLNMSPMDRKMADDSQQPKASLTKLLMLISETLSHWISERSYVLSDAETLNRLIDLFRLLFGVACLLIEEEDMDPSFFSVLRDLLGRWIETIDSTKLLSFTTAIQAELSSLSESLALTTGTSMSIIWRSTHPDVPSTLENWITCDRLLTFANEFATKVAGQIDHIDVILNINSIVRRSLASMLGASLVHEIPSEIFSEGVSQVTTGGNPDDNLFVLAYQCLQDFADLRRDMKENEPYFLKLSHLSGKSLHLDLLQRNSLFKPLKVLQKENLLERITGIELVRQCITVKYQTQWKLVNRSTALGSLSNDGFKLYRKQLHTFGQIFSQSSVFVAGSASDSLLSMLEEELRTLLNIHILSDETPSHIRESCEHLLHSLQSSVIAHCPGNFYETTGLRPIESCPAPLNYLHCSIASILAAKKLFDDYLERSFYISKAWIQFALACIALYVPDKPHDPAAAPILNLKLSSMLEAELSCKIESRREIERQFRGPFPSRRLESQERQLEEARVVLASSSSVTVYRPTSSQLPQLQHDLSQLLQLTVNSAKLDSLLTEIATNQPPLKTLISNLEQISSRLLAKYPYYTDILTFVVGSISRLLLGIRLHFDVGLLSTEKSSHPRFSIDTIISPSQLTLLESIDSWTQKRQGIASSRGALASFNLFELDKLVLNRNIGGGTETQAVVVRAILDHCYVEWRVAKERRRTEEAAKTDIYKRKDENDDLDAAISDYFPDYQTDDSDFNAVNKLGDHDVALRIYNSHAQLFGNRPTENNLIAMQKLLHEGLMVISHFTELFTRDEFVISALPALMFSFAETNDDIRRVKPSHYDFYRSPNFEETQLLLDLVHEVQTDVRTFLEAWPEHGILHDIILLCEKISQLPASAPLSRVLPYMERLYALTDQWQKVASRDYSLSTSHNKIKDNIVRWRRLELSSWKIILKTEERHHRENVSSWWFDIYEVAIYNLRTQNSPAAESLVKVIASINDFVTASTLGDFDDRLELLLSFARHAHSEHSEYPILESLARALFHMYQLYRQYGEAVRKSMQEQKTALETEIAETIQLASWRDTSVYALTESAKRSHYRLYKSIRKYRDLLSQPVAPILRQSIHIELKNIVEATAVSPSPLRRSLEFDTESIAQAISYCSENQLWPSDAQVFLNPLRLSSSIQRIFDLVTSISSDLPISPHEFVSTVEDLRKQTPSILTDENEKHVKFLKTEKRRLFAQTMRSLREWGVSSKLTDNSITSSAESTRLATTFVVDPLEPWGNQQSGDGRVDKYFYKILDLLPQLRSTAAKHSSDLSDAEFTRGQGYLETLINGLFDQRNTILAFEKSLVSAKRCVADTIYLLLKEVKLEEPCYARRDSAKEDIEKRRNILRRLDVIIETCISVFDAHKSLDPDANVANHQDYLRNLKTQGRIRLDQLSSISFSNEVLFGTAIHCVTDLDGWFNSVSEELGQRSSSYESFHYIFHQLKEVLASTEELHRITPNGVSSHCDHTRFYDAAEALGKSVLARSQDLSKVSGTLSLFASEPLSYPTLQSLYKVLQQLRLPSIEQKVEKMHSYSIDFLEGSSNLPRLHAVYTILRPILQQFLFSCQLLLNRLVEIHEEYSQMTLVLMLSFHTLATKGYCTPERAEKETTEAGQGQGVGLGEGEGETNISKEIQDDEDLEDLAQRDKEEAGESKEGDDDQEGVDMDDDFNGKMEDVPDKEGKEDGEEEEEQEDEMDDGIGDVDDDGVDEQFWEDQAQKAEKEEKQREKKGRKDNKEETGQLGAGDKEKQKEKMKEKAGNNDIEKDGEDEEQDTDREDGGVDDEEGNMQNRQEDDMFVPEAEPLDIGDDLHLDQNEKDGKDDSDLSDDGMDLDSQIGQDEGEEYENVPSGDEIEEQEGEEMEMEGKDQADEIDEMGDEEDHVNTQNVDQSEYQGDDVATSQAIGKGGERASIEEKNKGAQGDFMDEEKPESGEPTTSSQRQIPGGQGESQEEVQSAQRDDTMGRGERQDANRNALRRLGDMLERWRRNLENIQDVQDQEAEKETTVGEQNADFSYAGENEETQEQQALGPASLEQAQPLDMSTAMDEEPHPAPPAKDSEIPSDKHADGHDLDSMATSRPVGATIGEPSKQLEVMDVEQAQPSAFDDSVLSTSTALQLQPHLSEPTSLSDDARLVWQEHDRAVHDLSLSLCEQLRLILEPTQATKMRGDFRTGKRLNMRRIIPYIASDYKKDKIWMRRTKPSKRQYQVMLAVDDSKSMSDSKSVSLAFDTLALTAKALSQLEVGQISIVRFGDDVQVVHGFEEQFTTESGGKVVQHFKFDQSRTDVSALTRSSIELFHVARMQQDIRSTMGTDLWQLELIISDGICEDHETIRRMVREAFEAKIMMIFVILDALHPERKDSILDIKSYSFETVEGRQVLKEQRYLDSFPFNYFVVVRDVRELPSVLASALRQWFAEVSEI